MKDFILNAIPAWLTPGLVLIALFPFVGGVLAAYSEIFISKRRSKARLKRNLIVFGGLLSVIGALFGAVLQGRDSFRLWAFSTGADDYCYLSYAFTTNSAVKYLVVNNGEYPLFDVSVQVIDHNRWNGPGVTRTFAWQPPPEQLDEMLRQEAEATTQIPVGNLRPNEIRFAWDSPIPKDTLQNYYVSIWSRNSFMEEEVLLRRKDDGTFTSAQRVWKQTGRIVNGWRQSEIVKEEVRADFRQLYPSGAPWTLNLN